MTRATERRRADESVAEWLLREGVAWAFDTLTAWMEELGDATQSLGSPGLEAISLAERRCSTSRPPWSEKERRKD